MDSAIPTTIELDARRGHCPTCGRPILTHATGKCSYCGASVEAHLTESPEVQARLGQMAPGWDGERLKAWVRTRPTLLARTMQEEAWPCLSSWVAEPLWREWEGRERLRKANGQELRTGGVVIQQVSILDLGDATPWVAVRVVGRRSTFVVDRATGLVVSGNRGAKLFSEGWKLEATGLPESKTLLNCKSCGAPMAPEELRCGYCRNWQVPPGAPWRLLALQDLVQRTLEGMPHPPAQSEGIFSRFMHREEDLGDALFDGIMNNIIC
jgi:hypothetical protein